MKNKKFGKRSNLKSKIIKRQSNEIASLKESIANLNITCEQKDELIGSIDGLRSDLIDVLQDLDDKRNRYNELICELVKMKKIMNKEVFKGRWSIIRFLLR